LRNAGTAGGPVGIEPGYAWATNTATSTATIAAIRNDRYLDALAREDAPVARLPWCSVGGAWRRRNLLHNQIFNNANLS